MMYDIFTCTHTCIHVQALEQDRSFTVYMRGNITKDTQRDLPCVCIDISRVGRRRRRTRTSGTIVYLPLL